MRSNRRDFVKLGATAATGALAAPLARGEAAAHGKPADELRSRIDAALAAPVLERRFFPDPVRIDAVELLKNGEQFLVRVRSAAGATGLAVGHGDVLETAWPILTRRVAPHFTGKDARDLEALLEAVYLADSNYKWQGLAFWVPVACVELAVLDLLGQVSGKSVAELLGGRVRRDVAVYRASGQRGNPAEEEIDYLRTLVAETGAKAIKFRLGARMRFDDASTRRDLALIPLTRKVFGDEMTIYADANGSYDIPLALRIGRVMEEHRLAFFEEPVRFDYYDETKEIADALSIPLAGGEQESSLRRFRWMIEHRAVVNTLLWRNEFYGIQEGEVHLQIPSYAFDSSVVDIFSALLTGGTLVIPDEDARLDPRYLKGLMLEFGVHRFIMTPSFYKLVVKELTGSELKLRSVTLAGEAATLDLADEHYRHLPRVALYNEYGPTENAVCSTACLLASDATRISIGSPISNCGVAILDEGMRPLPVGVPGEIYLAGAGLARGYFNRPELTAARFLPNPLPQWPESRLYRTGDRGCWRPGGDLEFLGRVDHQVKIRGFRIELDEIEMALLRHEAVENAAALCKHDASGNPYLSAYVTLSGRLAKTSLRAYLQETLPYYMLPEFLHLLDNMPLTVNGKIDRAALEEYRDLDENASSEPSTESELERRLREIWLKVFKRDRIGIHDNFFEIGGNSLKVIEMISLIRAEMDRELAVLDLYNYPTVKRLALKIGEPVEASETHGDSA